MREAYIVSAVRTPTGRRRGMFSDVLPLTLSTIAVRAAVDRAGVAPGDVDDVILGCVTPIGEQGANIARLTALNARFPVSVPGVTINRMCGSSQQAVHFAAQAIMAGATDCRSCASGMAWPPPPSSRRCEIGRRIMNPALSYAPRADCESARNRKCFPK